MAGITLAVAQAKLELWLAANDGLASSQSYEITEASGTRRLTRANLTEVRNEIKYWDNWVKSLSRGGIRMRGCIPHD